MPAPLKRLSNKALRALWLSLLLAAGCLTWWKTHLFRPPGQHLMIAHALGGIEGKTYTNSEEAFETNYLRGFRLFEVDLLFLQDQTIAAFHSLDTAKRELGIDKHIFTFDKTSFENSRIYGKYHPLTIEKLVRILNKFPDTKLILDLKDSQDKNNNEDLTHNKTEYSKLVTAIIAEIKATDQSLLTRVIPQIYCEEDLASLNSTYQFDSIIYTLYRTNANDKDVLDFVSTHKQVTHVGFSTARFSGALSKKLKTINVTPLVYTVNSLEEAKAFAQQGAAGFYTDFIAPTQ